MWFVRERAALEFVWSFLGGQFCLFVFSCKPLAFKDGKVAVVLSYDHFCNCFVASVSGDKGQYVASKTFSERLMESLIILNTICLT